tara:strand:+ start:196 stop:444 length:249 start_codon:yes stop_codon:yes gene_type:complete
MVEKIVAIVGVVTTMAVGFGTFSWNQGIANEKINSLEAKSVMSQKKADEQSELIKKIEIKVEKMDTKMDEWFNRIETLIIEN